jgi:uncharacterized tellurite resistance protein B-like protein
MFDALKSLLFEVGKPGTAAPEPDDLQLAEAALMFHVIAADGEVSGEEESSLRKRLAARFSLSEAQTSELFAAARAADSEAVDLHRFASVLKRGLDQPARIAIIAELWEMVFADGVVHEVEDTVVWRVAQMLGVETRDRMAAKRKARETREGE